MSNYLIRLGIFLIIIGFLYGVVSIYRAQACYEPEPEPEPPVVTPRPPSGGGGGGPCRNCQEYIDRHPELFPEPEEDDDIEDVTTTSGPEICELPTTPTNFEILSGIPNDNTLELYYGGVVAGSTVVARYGHYDGEWLEGDFSNHPWHMSLGGLKNGQHYWVQVSVINDCGQSAWSESVDPLP